MPFPSCFLSQFHNKVLVHRLSYGNDFDLQDSEHVIGKYHFDMTDCAPSLVLKQMSCLQAQFFFVIHSNNEVVNSENK